MPNLAPDTRPATGKYLTFFLKQQRYSVSALQVREIVRLCPITPVPRTPAHLLGVINLRGKIVPVMDLRQRFGLEPATDVARLCIIVVDVEDPEGVSPWMGLMVDAVDDVSHYHSDELDVSPDFGGSIDSSCITGMAKSRGNVRAILDIQRLLHAPDSGDALSLSGRRLTP